jgi:hypothetical protein
MIWWVLIAVAVVVLVALAWWSSGRSKRATPGGVARARREGEVLRDSGPTSTPTNPGGM